MNRFKIDRRLIKNPYSVVQPANRYKWYNTNKYTNNTIEVSKSNQPVRQANHNTAQHANHTIGVTGEYKKNPTENKSNCQKILPEKKLRTLHYWRITKKKQKSKTWKFYNILKNYKPKMPAIPE